MPHPTSSAEGRRYAGAILTAATLALVQGCGVSDSATQSDEVQAIHEVQEVVWRPFGAIPGVEWAVLAGDPDKAGVPGALADYVIRLKYPAGSPMPSHWHPRPEYPMLISGDFLIGQGTRESCVPSQRATQGVLGFAPAEVVHCGYAETETVIQIMGPGPFELTLVEGQNQ
jgi:hypothetical protein